MKILNSSRMLQFYVTSINAPSTNIRGSVRLKLLGMRPRDDLHQSCLKFRNLETKFHIYSYPTAFQEKRYEGC